MVLIVNIFKQFAIALISTISSLLTFDNVSCKADRNRSHLLLEPQFKCDNRTPLAFSLNAITPKYL